MCRWYVSGQYPPPDPVKPAASPTVPRGGAAEAAEFKRVTLARLEAYRGREAGASAMTDQELIAVLQEEAKS